MKDSTKRLAIMRVLPEGAVTHMTAMGRQTSFEDLEAKVVAWLKNQEALGIVRSKHGGAMDLSSMAGQPMAQPAPIPATAAPVQNYEAMQRQIAELSAMVKGGGGKGNGGFGKGAPWSGYRPGQGSQGSQGYKGKGKGKGKGPSPAQVAMRRAAESNARGQPAEVMCPTQQKRGFCDYEARTGYKCKFMHAKNIPPALSAVEGLISTDLKEYVLTYNGDGTFNCSGGPEQPSMAAVAAAEVEQVAKILATEEQNFIVLQPGEGINSTVGSNFGAMGSQPPSVFPGPATQ